MADYRKIPFFNYSGLFERRKSEYMRVIEDVLSRGAFIMQRDCEEFEKSIQEYLGVKHCIGLANCTDALLIALRVAGVGAGDEVILPSHTFVATAAAIHFVGAIPITVDCGEDNLISSDAVSAAITSKTKAIMPVQLNGRTCQMDKVEYIATKHRLMIIEDSAQALGSKYKGRYAGTFGLAGTFSFYPAKILGCFGDGGALVTNDDSFAEEVCLMRDHGRNKNGKVVSWGLNSRLDNLHAAILNCEFKYYEQTIERRREIAHMYQEALKDIEALKLPPSPSDSDDHYDIYQNYEIEASGRDTLKSFLAERGIGTMIQWGGTPIHQMQELGFNQKLSATDALFEKCLMLPMNTLISDEDVEHICEQIKRFYS